MAVVLPPKLSDAHPRQTQIQTAFSVSKLISKLRSKRFSKRTKKDEAVVDPRPPLIPSPLPLVLPQHQPALSQLGWTTITFPQPQSQLQISSQTQPHELAPDPAPGPHPLQSASQALFAAAQQFFDQPTSLKEKWKHRLGSEEGWSKIPGEKEFITLRTLAYTPDLLKAPAKRYWDLMGAHLSSTLGRISTSLSLPDGETQDLRRFVGPYAVMGAAENSKTATMLRIFRYEGWAPKIVAEPHADLGLLSCVVGDVPGLEVWNGREFFDVERRYGDGGGQATVLVGRQLERFSNGRFPAGGHRVVSYGAAPPTPPPSSDEPRYRHSIVFVLRAHEPVVIDSKALETQITGSWDDPVFGITAGELYEQIRRAHFNINIGVEEREEQRRKVLARKGGEEREGERKALGNEASG
ncbi:hypothetical protein K458DRAFT_358967 [Lentithecium fluviatile CBS 122367]|uniref:Clavaminate synthase-like protein n=1 Tax=Lentithecium fluviatile CBS 122367 TaxID=1168545 RepID=A0A6G1JCR2_9PLEO|nr:hypothetical protein K458DRAFT_358967 [Lentithecium fluviatile CBS 122367]